MSTKTRGFASLSPAQRKAVSSKGGKAAWAQGTAHRYTREEAIEAGKKSGVTNRRKRAEREEAGEL